MLQVVPRAPHGRLNDALMIQGYSRQNPGMPSGMSEAWRESIELWSSSRLVIEKDRKEHGLWNQAKPGSGLDLITYSVCDEQNTWPTRRSLIPCSITYGTRTYLAGL